MQLAQFTCALLVIALTERFLNALAFVTWYLMSRTSPSEQGKAQAGLQITTSITTSAFQSFGAVISLFMTMLASLAQFAVSLFFVLLLSSLIYSLLEFSSLWMLEFTKSYNFVLGPSLQVLVVWPIKLLVMILQPLVPIWNAFFWIIKKIPSQILLNLLSKDLGYVKEIALSLASTSGATVNSLLSWVSSFICCAPGNTVFCNPQCYEAGERVFDLITPLTYMRQVAVYTAELSRGTCAILSGPIDIITYPLMDINFAEGLHFLANSAIYTLFHLPAVTLARCNAFRAESSVMCIPDFQPIFTMAVQGLRNLGQGIDNWIDVTTLVVQATLNFTLPQCTQIPQLLSDQTFQKSFFGSNATTMVGMTESLFAKTDGVGVQFFTTTESWETELKPNAFPFPITVNYGVAAIAHYPNSNHDTNGDDTMALLGCECQDTSTGFKILCGVAMFGGNQVNTTDRIIDVQFQLPSTAKYMACARTAIRVESIRWPASGFTTATSSAFPDCRSKGTCLQVISDHITRPGKVDVPVSWDRVRRHLGSFLLWLPDFLILILGELLDPLHKVLCDLVFVLKIRKSVGVDIALQIAFAVLKVKVMVLDIGLILFSGAVHVTIDRVIQSHRETILVPDNPKYSGKVSEELLRNLNLESTTDHTKVPHTEGITNCPWSELMCHDVFVRIVEQVTQFLTIIIVLTGFKECNGITVVPFLS